MPQPLQEPTTPPSHKSGPGRPPSRPGAHLPGSPATRGLCPASATASEPVAGGGQRREAPTGGTAGTGAGRRAANGRAPPVLGTAEGAPAAPRPSLTCSPQPDERFSLGPAGGARREGERGGGEASWEAAEERRLPPRRRRPPGCDRGSSRGKRLGRLCYASPGCRALLGREPGLQLLRLSSAAAAGGDLH